MAQSQCLPVKEFDKQYKEHLSGFAEWEQKDHAETDLVFPENIGAFLSFDDVALTQGELYTVVTNKAAQGKKGALVAMIQGTKASAIAAVLLKLPFERRSLVTEVTLDMADSMDAAIRAVFPNAVRVTDRFHGQQLVSEAVQEIRLTPAIPAPIYSNQ